MRTFIGLVVGLAMTATLFGCGEGSGGGAGGGAGGGPEGVWVADVEQLVAAAATEQVKAIPAEQRAAMLEQAKQMMRGMLKDARVELTLSRGGGATFEMAGFPGMTGEKGEGTWTRSGDKVVVTPKTKDGKPVTGEDAKPMDLTFKDGVLSLKPDEDAPTFALRRK